MIIAGFDDIKFSIFHYLLAVKLSLHDDDNLHTNSPSLRVAPFCL